MKNLGHLVIYIPAGAEIGGIIIVDKKQNPIGGTAMKLVTPDQCDWIRIEFAHNPAKEEK